jgi:hypothetical protein
MKDGKTTTEFYMAVVRQLLLVAVAVGVLTTGQVEEFVSSLDTLTAAITEFGLAVTPLILVVVDGWNYLKSRTQLKKAQLENG